MTLLDAAFRSRCARLDDAARRSWGSRFLGRPLEKRWAGGSEFVGHSDYSSGDDFRRVDWNLCARSDELLTRQYRGSEDRVVYLLLDCSAGMRLGQPVKFDVARRLAAALGYIALSNLDRVGVVALDGGVRAELSPVRSRSQLPRLFRFLDSLAADPAAVDLKRSMAAFVRQRPRRGLAVLISDLFDPQGFEPAVDTLARRGFQPYLMQVVDDREAEPDFAGNVQLVDAAGGGRISACLEDVDLVNYRRVFQEFSAGCVRYCARRSIGITQTRTGVPVEQSILRMIREATSRMHAGLG